MPEPMPPPEAVAAVERLLHRGEPLLAFNAAQEGLREAPGHVRLRQLQALALARSGDAPRAGAILQSLVDEGREDAETLGMLARTLKDLAQRAAAPGDRARHLDAAMRLYERAWREAVGRGATGDALYTGINAAAAAALSGDLGRARAIAAEVRDLGRSAAATDGGPSASYWREATLGEAALILGDNAAAAAHYAEAARFAEGRFGDLGSTRRQARLLAACLPGADPAVTSALAIAPVLVFTGHMVDAPGRPQARFPPSLEPAVREALRARIAAIRPVAAYGSAACGADLLCLELVREMGGETHVVLPFPAEEFRRASVDFAAGDWGARFGRALEAADSVTVTSDHRASGSTATFEYANLVLTGMARLRARLLDGPLRGLAVLDPAAAGAAGGAASLVPLWEARGIATDRLDLAELRGAKSARPAPPPPPADPPPAVRHEMRAMLFADAVGYSQLGEDQIPAYITGFLGAVAGLNRRTAHRFEHVETSGDGLYMVFRDAADAGHYALELKALVGAFDRAACGLPPAFDLRIALHCGPVHCARDPITGFPIYTGPHTSRAARIEPITPPGQVYASSAFAAVAAAGGADGLQMNYVGRIPLAKGYGTLALYHVLPAR